MYRFAFAALTASLIVSVAATAAPASVRVIAQPPGTAMLKAVTLQYDDQDLSSSSGAAALLARIEQAAQAGCGPARPANAAKVAACQKMAVKQAVEAVASPAVAQAAAAK